MVYSGIAATTQHDTSGGGSNYLCMPKVPEYNPNLTYIPRPNDYSEIEGVEYDITVKNHNHNVPCAVCHVITRSAFLLTAAHPPGPENTMATSCRVGKFSNVQCLSV